MKESCLKQSGDFSGLMKQNEQGAINDQEELGQ